MRRRAATGRLSGEFIETWLGGEKRGMAVVNLERDGKGDRAKDNFIDFVVAPGPRVGAVGESENFIAIVDHFIIAQLSGVGVVILPVCMIYVLVNVGIVG